MGVGPCHLLSAEQGAGEWVRVGDGHTLNLVMACWNPIRFNSLRESHGHSAKGYEVHICTCKVVPQTPAKLLWLPNKCQPILLVIIIL